MDGPFNFKLTKFDCILYDMSVYILLLYFVCIPSWYVPTSFQVLILLVHILVVTCFHINFIISYYIFYYFILSYNPRQPLSALKLLIFSILYTIINYWHMYLFVSIVYFKIYSCKRIPAFCPKRNCKYNMIIYHYIIIVIL